MIKRLQLRNFGPYEHADIALDRFTTFVGKNGAGKSILFTALRALGRVAKWPLRYAHRSVHSVGFPTRTGHVLFKDIVHAGDLTRHIVLGVEFETPAVSGSYEVHLQHWEGAGAVIHEEHFNATMGQTTIRVDATANGHVSSNVLPDARFRTPRFVSIPGTLFASKNPKEHAMGAAVQQALADRIGIYRFDPTALKTPAELGRDLSATGYNFASYLDKIRNDPGGPAEFDALITRFREMCPHVADVLLPTEVREGPRKRIALVMSQHAEVIPADLESDGTILLLAYASLLHGEVPHETLCIEEPENGVHPKAIPSQVKMLRELTQPHGGRPGAQILVCTHSRKFLDVVESDPTSIRLVRRGGETDGRSTVEAPTAAALPMLAGWAGLT
jgi:hypothetical protein